MRECGVSKRYQGAQIEDVPENTRGLFEDFRNGQSYFIFGPVGTGKTHLAAALINQVLRKRPFKKFSDGYIGHSPWPRFVSTPDLLLEIREVFGGRSDKTESEIIKRWAEMPILFLDDIGVEKATEWSLQTLYSIVDRRYREMRQTVITSNLNLEELAGHVGDRIASRIAEMCRVIHLKGRDRRLG